MTKTMIFVVTNKEAENTRAFTSIDNLVFGLLEELILNDIFITAEALTKHIQERAKKNYVELLILTDLDNEITEEQAENFTVKKVVLE